MEKVVIVDALRTPVGKFNGALANLSASDLGAVVIKALIEKHDVAEHVDEVIMSQVLTAGCGQNPARQASIKAGLSHMVPAMTINKVCGGGLKSINLAAQAIISGDADVVIAGGQENMSMAPHYLPSSRGGKKMGDWPLKDTMVQDGLWDVYENYHMGVTAENIAQANNISRQDQDEFALFSQKKAQAAIEQGRFVDEIVPVVIQTKKDSIEFIEDEYPRFQTTLDTLQALSPAFSNEGTVTAGNASGINDGAAALILMSEAKAKQLNVPILAYYKAFANAGVEPSIMGTGPVPASQRCLKKAGWNIEDVDLVEANEAFAAPAIYVNQQMAWPLDKVNVNGGAIAIGHPIGASGARIMTTLLHEMRRRKVKKGLATLCIGGGMGVALALECK